MRCHLCVVVAGAFQDEEVVGEAVDVFCECGSDVSVPAKAYDVAFGPAAYGACYVRLCGCYGAAGQDNDLSLGVEASRVSMACSISLMSSGPRLAGSGVVPSCGRVARYAPMLKSLFWMRRSCACMGAGRLCRELDRWLDTCSKWRKRLAISLQFINGERRDGHKIYSLHEPDVVCIAKGKDRVKYEFVNKVSIVRTWNGLLIGAISFRNEYDGHTIDPAMEQVRRLYPRQDFGR